MRKSKQPSRLVKVILAVAVVPMALCLLSSTNAEEERKSAYPTIGSIERLDPALDRLVPHLAKLEIIAEGFDWLEGPLWVPQGGFLLFCDIPRNRIYQWREGESHRLYISPSGYTGESPRSGAQGSNGLALDSQDRLILCQHGDRRVARLKSKLTVAPPKVEYMSLAVNYRGKRFNSPNDLAFYSNGDLYFTDPPYGLMKRMDDAAKELDFQGVYRLSTDGKVTLLTKEMTRPNGIAFSPDEKTLYVAQSDPEQPIWKAFPVEADGTLGESRVFFDASKWRGTRRGLPDGLKVDAHGNLFATGPGGVLVLSPEGKHLGTLLTTQATSNCAFGNDGSTLYITADTYLLRIRLTTKGMGY